MKKTTFGILLHTARNLKAQGRTKQYRFRILRTIQICLGSYPASMHNQPR